MQCQRAQAWVHDSIADLTADSSQLWQTLRPNSSPITHWNISYIAYNGFEYKIKHKLSDYCLIGTLRERSDSTINLFSWASIILVPHRSGYHSYRSDRIGQKVIKCWKKWHKFHCNWYEAQNYWFCALKKNFSIILITVMKIAANLFRLICSRFLNLKFNNEKLRLTVIWSTMANFGEVALIKQLNNR